jgi:RND family efflux transporter MFP subunit
MNVRRILGMAVVLIAVGGGLSYAYTNVLAVQTATTSTATEAPVSEAIYGTGTVEPARWAKVVPLQRRRLVEMCNCEGQNVKAGQTLGRQDDAEERSVLHELELNNEQLQRDLTRAEADRGKSDAAQRDYEQRWTQLEESKSRIAAQKVRINELVLRAPLDGMVLRRDGEVGEIAGPTDVLFWVGPPLPLQIVAEVNEEEINRITVGQKAFLRSDAFSGVALRASVSQITPKGDPARKTFRVYLLLPSDTPLRIGMSVEANIVTREKPSAIVVPAEAVSGDAVQIVDDGKARRVPVEVGIRGSRNVEIIGNVPKGAQILSPARPDLADGTRVRIDKSLVKPEPTASDASPQVVADRNMSPSSAAPAPAVVATDPSSAVLSAAISAHVDSVVNDARRNFAKYRGNR